MPTREELLKMLQDEDQAEREARERRLKLLEDGHTEAEGAVDEMRARWDREDQERERARAAEMERHEQGARDRDAMRVAMGGTSKIVDAEPPPPVILDQETAAQNAADALQRHQDAQDAWMAWEKSQQAKVVDTVPKEPETPAIAPSPVTAGASESAPPDVGNGAPAEGATA